MGAAPVVALTGEISLSDIQGPVGMRLEISGSGFTEGKTYTIHFGSVTITPSNNVIDSGGVFSNHFNVPDLSSGRYDVWVTTDVDDSTPKNFQIKVVINPVVTIPSTAGYVGDQVTVSGSGFTASTNARVLFDGAILGNAVATTSDGGFPNTVITIPATTAGSHTISASDSTGKVTPTLSFVVSPKITLTQTSGGAGDQVTVNGNGFAASQSLSVHFDSVLVPGSAATDANGTFNNLTFTVPASGRGNHTVEVKGGTNSVSATFTIAQDITLSPPTGAAGTVVSISGTGFTPGQTAVVKYNSIQIATNPSSLAVNSNGAFSGSFTVSGAAGAYLVEASDGTLTSSSSFTLVVAGSLAPKEVNVGTTISINATGFTPGATVNIAVDSVQVTTATVAANGGFSASFNAPQVRGGAHTVAASDSVNSFSDTFTMESTPPTAPSLLSPKDEGRGGRTPTFKWGAVTDPSGVTYDFQLATDSGFTALVYDKKAITAREFKIAKDAQLEPATKDAPYYWRVKTVDGASNESNWSTPFSFNTSSGFSLPPWAIYVLIGVGVVLVGLLGFWIGRRSAYY
jgi:hypothetical protein